MPGVLYITAAAFVALVSVRARAAQIERAYEAADRAGVEPKPSYLSRAIQETLAVAAGIYISLSALVSFLKVSIPPITVPGGLSIDPIPALAVVLALVQPLFGC